jgi:hypothetical protein
MMMARMLRFLAILLVMCIFGTVVSDENPDTDYVMGHPPRSQIYLSMSSKPSRVAYLADSLAQLDLETYDVKVFLNLPWQYGKQQQRYQIPKELFNNSRIIIRRIMVDMGPLTKVYPTFDTLVDDPLAVVISIDDDTAYPRDLVHRYGS